MRQDDFTEIEEILAGFPVCQYGFLNPEEILFSDRVRYICQSQCGRYGKSWSCPPAVGEVGACRQRCLKYEKVLVFTTLAEVNDSAMLEETLLTRKGHEEVMKGLLKEMEAAGAECMALSSESCSICEECTYPDGPCRYPDRMLPCIESYGILVTESAEKCGIDFFYDSQTVTWFGMIFFSWNQ